MTASKSHSLSGWKDNVLFTPGPLTTSRTVKQAMLRDLGSRDFEFIELVKEIRHRLLEIGEVASPEYEAILMQGSGTFGIESVISSVTPPNGRWMLLINGAYGERMARITAVHHIAATLLRFPENEPINPETVEHALHQDPSITHAAVVHCETTTGLLNPIEQIGTVVKGFGKSYMVDAMSSFGAIPVNLAAYGIDYLVSSANKCLEGVPGFSFALARREALLETEGFARTVSLNLLAQWRGLEQNGQFRFTPPTHALLAFAQALRELQMEGGVNGRAARYRHNYEVLVVGMRELGFQEYLSPAHQSYIITSFRYPQHPHFEFEAFYGRLHARGITIYPGKLSHANCFRIGTIGRLFESDVQALLAAVRETLLEMGVTF